MLIVWSMEKFISIWQLCAFSLYNLDRVIFLGINTPSTAIKAEQFNYHFPHDTNVQPRFFNAVTILTRFEIHLRRIHLRNERREDKLSHIPLECREREENLDRREMNGRLFETRLDEDAAPHGRVIKYLHCHRRSRRLIPELIVFHFIQRLRALLLYGVDKHGVVGSACTFFFFFLRN